MSGLFSLTGDPIGLGRLQGQIVENTPLKEPMQEFNHNAWMQAAVDPMLAGMGKLPAQYRMESPWNGMQENEDNRAKKQQESVNKSYTALANEY